MEGKRRDEEELQDSLVVEEGMMINFPLVPQTTCPLPLQLLLKGSFRHQNFDNPALRKDIRVLPANN